MAMEPTVIHDFSKQPGDTVQLDRYDFWGDPGTKESRERNMTQILGTANTRDINKSTVLVELKEYTGPGSLNNPNDPACFKIPLQKALFGQRLLWQGRLNQFHQSIGRLQAAA